MASDKNQLDSRIEIVTPENIAFEYRVAGPFFRLPAYLVDLTIRTGIVVIIAIVASLTFGFAGLGTMGIGVALVSWFVLSWFYGGLFETFWNGQTPGKRMMSLRVLSIDGQPINAMQAVLRNVLRAVDGMPMVFYQVGLFTSMMNDRYQRLGDLACGTIVVVEDRPNLAALVQIDDPAARKLATELPVDYLVSRSLARALIKYVERRRFFAPGRRAEIARHVGEILVERFQLPADTSHDLLLCALYHRAFITDRLGGDPDESSPGGPVTAELGQASTGELAMPDVSIVT